MKEKMKASVRSSIHEKLNSACHRDLRTYYKTERQRKGNPVTEANNITGQKWRLGCTREQLSWKTVSLGSAAPLQGRMSRVQAWRMQVKKVGETRVNGASFSPSLASPTRCYEKNRPPTITQVMRLR